MKVSSLDDLKKLIDDEPPWRHDDMTERYLFTTGKTANGEVPKLTAEECEDAYKFMQANGRTTCRVDERVHAFAAKYWHDEARKLQFATPQREYEACVREVAQRTPWVYLATAEISEPRLADITIGSEVGR